MDMEKGLELGGKADEAARWDTRLCTEREPGLNDSRFPECYLNLTKNLMIQSTSASGGDNSHGKIIK